MLDRVKTLHDKAGARSTLELLGRSKSWEDFNRLAMFGDKFGHKTPTLLRISGDDAVIASQRLITTPKATFLEAGTFGPDGIKALKKHGPEKFHDYRDARRRMTKLEKEFADSGKKSTILGKTFVKRESLFDPAYKDGAGLSNIQRMQEGKAPIGKDGVSIELHHMKQQNDGLIVEMTKTEHRGENGSILHRHATVSEIDRNEFNKIKVAYWKERVRDFE